MALLDALSSLEIIAFDDQVFRATRMGLDPVVPSTRGGRWASSENGASVLYTSLTEAGAMAELCYHWGLLTPAPTKPAALHTLNVSTTKTLRLAFAELESLGVHRDHYAAIPYERCQQIGEAVAFLEYDGLIVPSARRTTSENLVLFSEHHSLANTLEVAHTEECDWREWAKSLSQE